MLGEAGSVTEARVFGARAVYGLSLDPRVASGTSVPRTYTDQAVEFFISPLSATMKSTERQPRELSSTSVTGLGELKTSPRWLHRLGLSVLAWTRYGPATRSCCCWASATEPSRKTPTSQRLTKEWDEARRIGKPVLAFVEDVSQREGAQDRFVAEVSDWEDGCKWASYGSPDDVFREVFRALAKFIADPTLSSKGWRRLRQIDQDARRCRKKISVRRRDSAGVRPG